MADIAKTTHKGLGLPKHFDPSMEQMKKNMEVIDDILQKAVPNDLASTTDANAESNANTLKETGNYFIKSNASNIPVSGYAGIISVFKMGTYILQEWRSINSPNYTYRRYSTNTGSSWGGWAKDWNANNDGSGSGLDADTLDGLNSSLFMRTGLTESSNFNNATAEGKYRITGTTNAPYTGCTDWIVLVFQASGGTNELYQIAMEECYNSNTSITGGTTTSYSYNVPMIFVRKRYSGTWYSWQLMWNSGNDGSGSGMDADKLDGNHASAFATASHAKSDGSNGKATDTNYGHVRLSTGINKSTTGAISDGVAFGYKHITSANVDSLYTTGFYALDTSATCANGLPFANVTSVIGYGLLVLRTQLTAGNDCCTQIIFVDGGGNAITEAQDVYYRAYHESKWTNWRQLSGSANDILTKLKTVDGSGSGLDADTLDGLQPSALSVSNADMVDNVHASALAGTNTSYYTADTSLPNKSGIYILYTSSIEGSSRYYGVTKAYYSTSNYTLIAVSLTSGKVFRKTYSQSSWSEITPLIPVVTSDPSSPSEGQMWIRSDLM